VCTFDVYCPIDISEGINVGPKSPYKMSTKLQQVFGVVARDSFVKFSRVELWFSYSSHLCHFYFSFIIGIFGFDWVIFLF